MTAHESLTAQDPLDFLAFRELVRPTYLRYAQARLEVPGLAQAAVEAAFAGVRRDWSQTLSSASAPRAAWHHLRHEVSVHLGKSAAPQAPLAGVCGDAALLHWHLGVPLKDIASVMGVTVTGVRALLVRAGREGARRTG